MIREDDFEKGVFINCPFDGEYHSLLRPLLFTIIYLGFTPRIALERSDSLELRLNKIAELERRVHSQTPIQVYHECSYR